MMNTVRDTFSSIGDRGGDLARSVGSGTTHLARRVGSGTVDLARDIGPKRALIGLAVAAVAIGGSILVLRYLRARRSEAAGIGGDDRSSGDIDRPSARSDAKHAGYDSRVTY
jgi:hypothetical protein